MRRKLILSYVFIGVVPALLIVAFFILCGLLLVFHVSSYLVQSRLRSLTEQAQFHAKAAALELQRSSNENERRAILERREASVGALYPGASIALVPTPPSGCAGAADAMRTTATRAPRAAPIGVGSWAHMDAPRTLPAWVGCAGFGGVLAYVPAGQPRPSAAEIAARQQRDKRISALANPETDPLGEANRLVIRGAALPDGPPIFAVIVDIPVNRAIADRLRDETGIHLGRVSIVLGGDSVRPAIGKAEPPDAAVQDSPAVREPLSWVTLLDTPTGRRAVRHPSPGRSISTSRVSTIGCRRRRRASAIEISGRSCSCSWRWSPCCS